jgi:hypothetical protein
VSAFSLVDLACEAYQSGALSASCMAAVLQLTRSAAVDPCESFAGHSTHVRQTIAKATVSTDHHVAFELCTDGDAKIAIPSLLAGFAESADHACPYTWCVCAVRSNPAATRSSAIPAPECVGRRACVVDNTRCFLQRASLNAAAEALVALARHARSSPSSFLKRYSALLMPANCLASRFVLLCTHAAVVLDTASAVTRRILELCFLQLLEHSGLMSPRKYVHKRGRREYEADFGDLREG